MSKFSSFKPLFSKLAEKQSRKFLQLATESHSNTNVQPGASPKALWELHRLVLVQSQSRQELCTISKLKKGAALRVPDKSLLYLEQRQKKGNPCWYSTRSNPKVLFSFLVDFCFVTVFTFHFNLKDTTTHTCLILNMDYRKYYC